MNSTAIRCIGCNVQNLEFTDSTFSGAFTTDLHVNSLATHVKITGSIFSTPSVHALYLKDIRGFFVQLTSFTCGVTPECIYLYGSSALIEHVWDRNTVYTNLDPSLTQYTGIYWNVDQELDLSQIDLLTLNFTLNTGISSNYGLHIVVPNLEIYYPCVTSDNQYIRNLAARNPTLYGQVKNIIITGLTDTIETAVLTGQPGVQCFVKAVDTSSMFAFVSVYISLIGMAAGAAIVYFYLCMSGARLQMDRQGWRRERNFDKIQGKTRFQFIRDKVKSWTGI